MQALVLKELKSPLVLEDREDLEPGPGEVVVQLKAAALNRRDYWITQGLYPGIQLPVVPGSDGAGVVARVGAGVAEEWLGKEVMINPGWNWGDDPAAQSGEFQILGMPHDGTFATEVAVPVEYLHEKPAHLNWSEAAALSLAGMTAFRALVTQGGVEEEDRVLVTGIGGGVATFALQFAVAIGAEVLVTSSSSEKVNRAVELGAAAGFDYRAEGWAEQVASEYGPVDLIIDSAGGPGYAHLLELAAPGGRIVNYGATAGAPAKLDLFKVFWKQLHLIGSTMGSPEDFVAMVDLTCDRKLAPVIDSERPLRDGNAALDLMRESGQFGKIVLTM